MNKALTLDKLKKLRQLEVEEIVHGSLNTKESEPNFCSTFCYVRF